MVKNNKPKQLSVFWTKKFFASNYKRKKCIEIGWKGQKMHFYLPIRQLQAGKHR
jgi:hypothetical protein